MFTAVGCLGGKIGAAFGLAFGTITGKKVSEAVTKSSINWYYQNLISISLKLLSNS